MLEKARPPRELIALAERIQRNLLGTFARSGFTPEKLKPDPAHSGGWSVILASHRSKDLTIDVWLDRWTDAAARRVSYCFSSHTPSAIRLLVATSSQKKPTLRRFDRDLKTDRVYKSTTMKKPFTAGEYGRPFYSVLGNDEAYLGVYEISVKPFSRPGVIADRAIRFFQRTLPRPQARVRLRESRRIDRDAAAEAAAAEAHHRTPDPQALKAVERHAMAWAKRELHAQGWKKVKDVSRTCSFDYYCTSKGRRPLRVEVKGTIGDGEFIPVTANEIRIAQTKRAALVLVHSVSLRKKGKKLVAAGGILERIEPWRPLKAQLEPTAHLWWHDSKPPKRSPRDVGTNKQ
jgi:hypothetical protein